MKKSLIFIAILAVAITIFAETLTCEAEKGNCTYTLSAGSLSKECYCNDDTRSSDTTSASALPTEDECKAEANEICQNAGIKCKNEAGECILEESGDYECWCYGFDRRRFGTVTFGAGVCDSTLVEECGTELATPRIVCTDAEVLNTCLSYVKTFANSCFEPLSDEGLEAVLDIPSGEDLNAQMLTICCYKDDIREEDYKGYFECIEAAESCENKECCDGCGLYGHSSGTDDENPSEEGDNDVISPAPDDSKTDADDNEIPNDGDTEDSEDPVDDADMGDTGDSEDPIDNADTGDAGDTEDPMDSADSDTGDSADPTDEKTAPEENKKEDKKSDGCSLLFV